MEALLSAHPDAVDRRNAHGNTPIRTALSHGHLEVAKQLVELGADTEQINHGGSSLMEAVGLQGSPKAMLWLESQGLNPGIIEFSAVGNVERVKQLIDANPLLTNVRDRRMQTPLHWAAHGGHATVINLLVSVGADVRAVNRHGHEPLALAVEASQDAAVDRLLFHGACADCSGGHYRGRVLHRAVLNRSEAVARMLLEAGADPNAVDAGGKMPLHQAISIDSKSLVVCLLESGRVNLSARCGATKFSEQGETPFEYAVHRKRTRIAELIRISAENNT